MLLPKGLGCFGRFVNEAPRPAEVGIGVRKRASFTWLYVLWNGWASGRRRWAAGSHHWRCTELMTFSRIS